jgi:hypothetical protein
MGIERCVGGLGSIAMVFGWTRCIGNDGLFVNSTIDCTLRLIYAMTYLLLSL